MALAPDEPDAQKLVLDCEKDLEEEKAWELDLQERTEIIRKATPDDDILGFVRLKMCIRDSPNIRVNRIVDRDALAIFTILLPIRIVDHILS